MYELINVKGNSYYIQSPTKIGLVKISDTAVALIAQSVGYADAFAFSKAFKKHYGITPSEAKKVSIP